MPFMSLMCRKPIIICRCQFFAFFCTVTLRCKSSAVWPIKVGCVLIFTSSICPDSAIISQFASACRPLRFIFRILISAYSLHLSALGGLAFLSVGKISTQSSNSANFASNTGLWRHGSAVNVRRQTILGGCVRKVLVLRLLVLGLLRLWHIQFNTKCSIQISFIN